MLGNRLVIGLDYGTTYTGISFCETSDNDLLEKHIEVIHDWPGRGNVATQEKVPSQIAYTLEETHWGATIPAGLQRHMWTKLELDPVNECSRIGDAGKIMHEQMSLTGPNAAKMPVEVVADFLRNVKGHLVKNLNIQFGEKLWRSLPITLVVTVPAVWSDAAKALTMQAVNNAGFNANELPKLKRILTITEPEAAALYTMKSFSGSIQGERFAVGDGFIVCDLGGGTGDLISYRISGLQPTTLEEATIGKGALCGGSFVDREFIKFLERRLGTEDFMKIAGCRSADVKRTNMPPKLAKMIRTFVLVSKAGFTGKEVNFLPLPHPLNACEDDETRGISEGELMIKVEHMIQMFEGPLAKIRELLVDQIAQAAQKGSVRLKFIFMVGGFSMSDYVYDEISALAKDYGLEVIRPANAWSAIVRGATAKGLEGDGRQRITNRKCRRFYGTGIMLPFMEGRHKKVDKTLCAYSNSWYASNQMQWLLKKDQDLSTSSQCHAKHSLLIWWWPNEKRTVTLNFYATDADKAPFRTKHEDVRRIAELCVDASEVPQHLLKTKYNASWNSNYYELKFNVEVCIQSALEFSMSVCGKKYGSVTAKYT